ncbi:MAG: S41 family peptidase [Anaerolineales bacterium]
MNKFIKYTLVAFIAIVFLLGSFSGGVIVGHLIPANLFGNQGVSATPNELQTLFAPFWESWTLVHQKYVDQPLDDTKLMRGAIQGMLGSLGDAHTSYMDPAEYKDSNSFLAGSYEGIGAYVDTTGDYLTIMSTIKDSPALKAGLQSGDKIVKIDGKDMTGISAELVREKVLGPAGTVVTLTILRGTQDPFDVKVTRAKITIASVESKMLGSGLAYVQINTFGDTTTQELRAALKDLMAQHPKGLILDLRNNGGGYLDTAVEVGSEFINKGPILFEKYGDGTMKEYDATSGGQATDIPMVVLVNEGTASASEIVSGALQDDKRAKLVGVLSYGKGSVQEWLPLSNNQGAVRITIAKWLTPLKRTIDHVGLTPDVVVKMTKDDYTAGRDPQLDSAIQTLLAMIK